MKGSSFFISILIYSTIQSTVCNTYAAQFNAESLEGVNHYGLPIEEVTKKINKDSFTLDIVYSKTLSDDSMDKFVKMFFDELIAQISRWLQNNEPPQHNLKIIISNCKYCIVGYCKKKNIKRINLMLYCNEKKCRELSITHQEIIDKTASLAVIDNIISNFFQK